MTSDALAMADDETRSVEGYNVTSPQGRCTGIGFLVRCTSTRSTRFIKFGSNEEAAQAFARGETQ